MYRLAIILFTWLFTTSIIYTPQTEIRGVFGVKVSFQANAQLLTYVCYIYNGRVLTNKRYLTQREFLYFASGTWPSIYNQERRNLFAEKCLPCGIFKDSISKEEVSQCIPLDSLWKLRFSTFPYRNSNESGWSAQMYKPSTSQAQFLYSTYAVKDVDADFFMDDNLWRLLQDVQKKDWVEQYKHL